MEAFGVAASRPIPLVSDGRGVEPHSGNTSFSGLFCRPAVGNKRNLRTSDQSLKVSSFPNFVYSDQGYLDFYSSGRKISCGICKEKEKGEKEMKKGLKTLKGLSRELAMFSQIGSYSDSLLFDPLKANTLSEAAKILQGQLHQLRSEEKKLKQKRKKEKNKFKAAKMQEVQASSSSSSESSDSEVDCDCRQGVDMTHLNCNPPGEQITNVTEPIPVDENLALPGTSIPRQESLDDSSEGNSSVRTFFMTCGNLGTLEQGRSPGTSGTGFTRATAPAAKKIEVCLGGKCKKSGAALLIEKFRTALGTEADVSGCKCMGKCRDGPNVRISDNFDGDMDDVLAHENVNPPAANRLCIGVGLEDVDLIVENFLSTARQDQLHIAAASG